MSCTWYDADDVYGALALYNIPPTRMEGAMQDVEHQLALGAAWKCARSVQAPAAAASKEEQERQMELFCDIFDSPFEPAVVRNSPRAVSNGVARELAEAAYENRRLPDGTLDETALALLADALEDAGCTDAGLLGHLRSPRAACAGVLGGCIWCWGKAEVLRMPRRRLSWALFWLAIVERR
jgi:hypothetical protein